MQAFRDFIAAPQVLLTWAGLVGASLAVLIWDLWRHNRGLMSLMKLVWGLTVLYSGPIGLMIYAFAGRKQIPRDSLFRKGFRSDAHCYSGCGAGEILGVLVVAGGFGVSSNWAIGLVTFAFAYVLGFSLTVGPLMQEGEAMRAAVRGAFWGETTSITMMEAAAIAMDLVTARRAQFQDPLFWGSLIVSLSVGLMVAYPVNVALIYFGVKEGMMNPRQT